MFSFYLACPIILFFSKGNINKVMDQKVKPLGTSTQDVYRAVD